MSGGNAKKGIGLNKLSIGQKIEILEKLAANPLLSKREVARVYNVSSQSISYIVKRKKDFENAVEDGAEVDSKRIRPRQLADQLIIDQVLTRSWNGSVPTSRDIFTIANEVAVSNRIHSHQGKGPSIWRASRGWYSRFTKRVNITALLKQAEVRNTSRSDPGISFTEQSSPSIPVDDGAK